MPMQYLAPNPAAAAETQCKEQEKQQRDLGVSPYSMARWKKRYATAPASASPGVTTQELERENRALRRENEDLRQQRSILKKALAIVSEAPRGGMA